MTDRNRSHLTGNGSTSNTPHWFARFLALVFLLLCVAVGMAGLILPVIPGLLFLALAGIIAASIFPPLERHARRFPVLSRYLDKARGVHALGMAEKLQFAGWLVVRVVVDSFRCVLGILARLLSVAVRFGKT
jgi:uncharacterized membrane protein YbaN (DUF454 family)